MTDMLKCAHGMRQVTFCVFFTPHSSISIYFILPYSYSNRNLAKLE